MSANALDTQFFFDQVQQLEEKILTLITTSSLPIPIEKQIWTADECAKYLRVSVRKFKQDISTKRSFPKKLNLDKDCQHGTNFRWKAHEVMAWAAGQRY